MFKIILSLFMITYLNARTKVLSEKELKDSSGNVYYILSICKDGYLHTAISREEYLTISIAQDFIYSIDAKQVSGIECQYDFKSEQELNKINKRK